MAVELNGDGVRVDVEEYYGKTLQKSDDLKTNACCTSELPPLHIRKALAKVHPEVLSKYYGCGLVVPDDIEGLRVLDLGCGAGRDVYTIAQLVGPTGYVVGLDMTQEQLDVANSHLDWHKSKFGYEKSNVEFVKGYIEKLEGLESESFDLIVSNCVVNLSPDKDAVLQEAYRVLKPGGELYFSDVYSSRRVPKDLREHKVLWGECISGALYWNDFVAKSIDAGFKDPRLVEDSKITIENKALEELCGMIKFYSATYRLWKLPGLLDKDCEDYGQAVVYKGTIPYHPNTWSLDNHHAIEKGRIFPVCGNTFHMLNDTRFAKHFDFIGDKSTHYGIYAGCGGGLPFTSELTGEEACC